MKSAVLAIVLAVWSAPAPADPASESEIAIDHNRVAGWVKRWQERLKLQDWRIESRIVRKSELKPDTLGNLKWNSEDKSAIIRVLDPRDYDLPASRIAEDMELTVVHELIHLHLSVLPRDPQKKGVEEQVVDKISVALFNLERQADIVVSAGDSRRPGKQTGVASRERHPR
jgi:hypothetical protein